MQCSAIEEESSETSFCAGAAEDYSLLVVTQGHHTAIPTAVLGIVPFHKCKLQV
jgi:hypothetical protein